LEVYVKVFVSNRRCRISEPLGTGWALGCQAGRPAKIAYLFSLIQENKMSTMRDIRVKQMQADVTWCLEQRDKG
jgi:hypothetical protein